MTKELRAYIKEHGLLFFLTQLYMLSGAEMDKTVDLIRVVTEAIGHQDLQEATGVATDSALSSSVAD